MNKEEYLILIGCFAIVMGALQLFYWPEPLHVFVGGAAIGAGLVRLIDNY